ncbi:MAG: carboxypeptidase-like regulatory domain-containing protein [Bacteroidota bacterium]
MNPVITVLTAAFFFLCEISYLNAQSKLQGKVYMKEGKKNVPLVNDSAQVMLVNLKTQDSTFVFTKEGHYYFKEVKSGQYDIRVYCLYCKAAERKNVSIFASSTYMDFVIEPFDAVNKKKKKK